MKSLGIRPREDLLRLFVSFPFLKSVNIFGFLFPLFMGIQSSNESNLVEMSVPV